MTTVHLAEAGGALAPASGTRRYRARLIEGDRWGSSGYYPADVLRRDGPTVWPAGTLMYLDHPALSETVDRPERSVRDLAGRIASTPTYDGDGLYADIEVFPHTQPIVDGLAESVGLSIRARGTAEQGERDGRTGPVITALTEGTSVDFVTQAGAGGKLVALLESAQTLAEARNVGHHLEARLHSMFTDEADRMFGDGRLTRDERITLSNAIGDGLQAFSGRVESDAPHLYQRDPYAEPDETTAPDVTEASEPPAQVRPATDVKPHVAAMRRVHEATAKTTPGDGTPPAATTTTEGSPEMGDTTADVQPAPTGGTGVTESAATRTIALGEAERLTQLLAEARTTVAEATKARDDALAQAKASDRRALVVEAKHAAEKQARTALAASPLTEASHQAVVDRVCDSLTVAEDGKVDAKALGEAITAEIDRARRQEAAILEAHGAGVPRGLGATGDQHEMTESEFTQSLSSLFGRLGCDEKTAQAAAKGR